MNISDKCGACGTPKSKNRFSVMDCPHCYSENFVGFSPAEEEIIPIKKTVVDPLVLEEIEISEEL